MCVIVFQKWCLLVFSETVCALGVGVGSEDSGSCERFSQIFDHSFSFSDILLERSFLLFFLHFVPAVLVQLHWFY